MDWTPSDDPVVRRRFRRAVVAAYVAFALNLAASLGAAIFLEPGGTMHPLDERAKYVLAHLRDWQATWAIWMAAAPSLVLFYAAFASTLADELALVRWAAVAIAALGAVCDVYAEVVLAFPLPKLYAQLPAGIGERALFSSEQLQPIGEKVLKMEGAAVLLTGGLANGLYTLAGAMLAYAVYMTAGFPRRLAWASVPAWVCGAALSVSCLLREPRATAFTMAATMACFLLWLALVVVFLWKRATSPRRP